MDAWTVGALLEATTRFFQERRVETPRLDAEILLGHVLDCPRIQLYTMYDARVADPDRVKYRELVISRSNGCPSAYLVGQKEFFSLRMEVGPSVLIPRPETEHLVVEALSFAKKHGMGRFVDVGTGSGAIAIALAHELPSASGVALDVSDDALAVAKKNAERHGVADRIEFRRSNLFEAMKPGETFDLIISNPPYVASEEWAELDVGVRHYEPRIALDGGSEGLEIARLLISSAVHWLRPGGQLLLEIGAKQELAIRAIFESTGAFELFPTIKDLSGHPRVLAARKRSS